MNTHCIVHNIQIFYTSYLNVDCFDHGEDYVIKDTCIDNTVENCPKTNNAKVCEPSSTENVVSQNIF